MWQEILKSFWFLGWTKALFSFQNFLSFDTIEFLFLFDKYCPIMEQLGLKDLSYDLQINCVISFYFSYI
jgi:hypothetical protein